MRPTVRHRCSCALPACGARPRWRRSRDRLAARSAARTACPSTRAPRDACRCRRRSRPTTTRSRQQTLSAPPHPPRMSPPQQEYGRGAQKEARAHLDPYRLQEPLVHPAHPGHLADGQVVHERLDRARGELELELPVRFVLWAGTSSRVRSLVQKGGERGRGYEPCLSRSGPTSGGAPAH